MSKDSGSNVSKPGVAVERQLPCELTETELLERGEQMANAEIEIDKLKSNRRAVNKQIAEQADMRAKYAEAIEAGEEMRLVICHWKAFESEKLWRLFRDDTSVEIESRPMTAADLQGNLEFPSESNSGAMIGDIGLIERGDGSVDFLDIDDDDDGDGLVPMSPLQKDIAAADVKLASKRKPLAKVKPKPKPVKAKAKSTKGKNGKSTRAYA